MSTIKKESMKNSNNYIFSCYFESSIYSMYYFDKAYIMDAEILEVRLLFVFFFLRGGMEQGHVPYIIGKFQLSIIHCFSL